MKTTKTETAILAATESGKEYAITTTVQARIAIALLLAGKVELLKPPRSHYFQTVKATSKELAAGLVAKGYRTVGASRMAIDWLLPAQTAAERKKS